jgi:hypothetical protein
LPTLIIIVADDLAQQPELEMQVTATGIEDGQPQPPLMEVDVMPG